MAPLTIRAHAKVNLDLRLGSRRPDGFHPIDTLFVRTDVADHLSVTSTSDGSLSLVIEGDEGLSAGPDNLVLRAAQALRAVAGLAVTSIPEATADTTSAATSTLTDRASTAGGNRELPEDR